MFRLHVLLLAGLFVPTAAWAQVLPADAEKTLWCAEALIAAGQASGGEDSPLQARGQALLGRVQLRLLELGFSDQQIATLSENAHESAAGEILGDDGNPRYSYEECIALEDAQ